MTDEQLNELERLAEPGQPFRPLEFAKAIPELVSEIRRLRTHLSLFIESDKWINKGKKAMADEIARLRAPQWRSMESAPMNELVLIVVHEYNDPSRKLVTTKGFQANEGWQQGEDNDNPCYPPVKWQPLPEPPKEGE